MDLRKKFEDAYEADGFSKQYINYQKIADDYAIVFTEWLIKKCDFQKHGCWLYKGMEMTQKELLEVFKNDIESNKH